MAKFGSWPEPENLMPKFDNGDDDDVGETEIQYLAMNLEETWSQNLRGLRSVVQ